MADEQPTPTPANDFGTQKSNGFGTANLVASPANHTTNRDEDDVRLCLACQLRHLALTTMSILSPLPGSTVQLRS